MRRGDFPPADNDETLFDIPAPTIEALTDVDPNLPLDVLAQQVAQVRARNVEARKAQVGTVSPVSAVDPTLATVTSLETKVENSPPAKAEAKRGSGRIGGAFISGLKRYTKQTDPERLKELTSKHDLALLRPETIELQLSPIEEELTYNGILFTPTEYERITLSPLALSKRVGAHILKHTTDRPIDARNHRKAEVQQQVIQSRAEAADAALSDLRLELADMIKLEAQISLPRHAHMSAENMDALMGGAVQRFFGMLEAVMLNHKIDDSNRELQLQAALAYSLAQRDEVGDSMHAATYYWHDLTNVYIRWTNRKIASFESIKEKVDASLAPSA